MKLLALAAAALLIVFAALAWHELTEPYEPGGGWRPAAGWILLSAYLLLMAFIAAAGSLDYGLLGRLLDRHRQRGRHRRQYADVRAQSLDTIHAWDHGGPTLPVVWVAERTPVEVVLDEQPTGGER